MKIIFLPFISCRPERVLDSANWMGKLPDHVRNRPVTTLAIPGSHDSATYELDLNAPWGADTPMYETDQILPDGPLLISAFFEVFELLKRSI